MFPRENSFQLCFVFFVCFVFSLMSTCFAEFISVGDKDGEIFNQSMVSYLIMSGVEKNNIWINIRYFSIWRTTISLPKDPLKKIDLYVWTSVWYVNGKFWRE